MAKEVFGNGVDKPCIIKFDGDASSYVWKHPIEDFCAGSQLIVHESQEAIFFKNGEAMDIFSAGRYTLDTSNLPKLSKLFGARDEKESVFHSEVYFVNLNAHMAIKWGTDSKIRMFDPVSGLHIELGAFGEANLIVTNSKKFLIKLVGTAGASDIKLYAGDNLNSKDTLIGKFKGLIINRVKSCLAHSIKENNINILEVDERIAELSEYVKAEINAGLDAYGLNMPEFYISSIATPDDDANFKRLKQQHAEQYLNVRQENIKKATALAAQERIMVEANTQAQVDIIKAQGEAQAYRLKAQAEADEMRMKGYTYQDETARKVGVGLAENEGGGNGSMVSDIVGLGVGLGAMGSVAGAMKDAMSPVMGSVGTATTVNGWDCACGQKGVTGNFCSNCGAKKPVAETWDCACGQKGVTGNFCSNCGAKKPVVDTWDCACGQKNITGNFCNNCGTRRPQ